MVKHRRVLLRLRVDAGTCAVKACLRASSHADEEGPLRQQEAF
jgi:hypothetical protein